jgi:hypothetical protein
MEFAIPITEFDIAKIKWAQPRYSPFRKTIPFTYDNNPIHFNNLILAFHPMKVVEVDYEKHQMVIEEIEGCDFLNKIEELQDSVSSEIEKHSESWLTDNVQIFPIQPWLKSGKLTLYLSEKPDLLNFYTSEGKCIFSDKTIKPGDIIRAIVKIHGISLQMSEDDNWTGKSRIQHHILQLYKINCE